jgi:hypothetical protein
VTRCGSVGKKRDHDSEAGIYDSDDNSDVTVLIEMLAMELLEMEMLATEMSVIEISSVAMAGVQVKCADLGLVQIPLWERVRSFPG